MGDLNENEEMIQWMAKNWYKLHTEENKLFFLKCLKGLPENVVLDVLNDLEELVKMYGIKAKKLVKVENPQACAEQIVDFLKESLKKELAEVEISS